MAELKQKLAALEQEAKEAEARGDLDLAFDLGVEIGYLEYALQRGNGG